MQANAVVFTAPNMVSYQEVTCPEPGPGDVMVRVTHSWISNGTECSFLRGERIGGDTPYRPGDPWPFPLVPGYQKIGVVEWMGEQVTDLAVGETVFAATGRVEGMFRPMGGHISPSISPREQVWKLPPEVEPLAFAGLVLTQVGYNCGVRPLLEVGDRAVVIGDGQVGHWAAQTLAWRGAQVILIGRHADRLARFTSGPFRRPLDAGQADWLAELADIGPFQVAVDTVGSIEVVEKLVPLMKRGGHLVSAGFYGTADRLALQPLRDAELAVDLVSGWVSERMTRTRDLIAAGYLETLPLISHHFPVERVGEAWALIESKPEPVLGVILDWSYG